MIRRSRRSFSPEQKISILREHLIDRDSVSAVCDRHLLQPTVFYRWQKRLFDNGQAALQRSGHRTSTNHTVSAQTVDDRLNYIDGMIAELMLEYVELKKELGAVSPRRS